MPWSGGVYTRGYASWVTDANNALPISASKFDTEDNDFASGLNNCLTIDGLNKPTSTLNWAVQMNWTRGTDGNIWSLARTGGVNNPKIQGSVTDATGVTLAVSGGSLVLSGNNLSLGATAATFLGPVAAAQVDMTPDKSNWTSTLSGPWVVGNNITAVLKWERQGTQVTVWCDAGNSQSTTISTTISASGLPAAITPSSTRIVPCCSVVSGALTNAFGTVSVNTNNTLTISLAQISGSQLQGGPFAQPSTAGITTGFSITYSL